jgi:hypothetical protein
MQIISIFEWDNKQTQSIGYSEHSELSVVYKVKLFIVNVVK